MQTLVAHYRDALVRTAEEEIRASLSQAPTPAVHRRLATALEHALTGSGEAPGARLFAIPVLLVIGGRGGAVVPGVVPDIQRLRQVLERHDALGPMTSFGLGNALCAADALAAVPFSRIHALAMDIAHGATALEQLALPPAPVRVHAGDEMVELRFLVGAAVTSPRAPSITATGSAIASWGMPFTHELSDQLRVDGVSLLPIPRPPADIWPAQAIGMITREELALQVFVSRELRRLRSEAGEPHATLAALSSGRLGLRFASPFIDGGAQVHERALHPSEDWNEVVAGMVRLLQECRVDDIRMEPDVLEAADFRAEPAGPR